MKIPKNETVQARVDPNLKLKLKKVAEKRRLSEAEIIRLSLKKFLSNVSTNVREA